MLVTHLDNTLGLIWEQGKCCFLAWEPTSLIARVIEKHIIVVPSLNMSDSRSQEIFQKARRRLRKAVEVMSVGLVHSLRRRRFGSAEEEERSLGAAVTALKVIQEE